MFFKKKKPESTEEEVEAAIEAYQLAMQSHDGAALSEKRAVLELIDQLQLPEREEVSRKGDFFRLCEKAEEEQQRKGLEAIIAQLGTCQCGSTRFAMEPIRVEKIVEGYTGSLRVHYVECRGCRRVTMFSRTPLKGEYVTEISTKRETGPFRDS